MYRVEVKHAFGMFLRKTQKEIKDTFPDGESKAIEDHYKLEIGKEVDGEVKKAAINESEGIMGQLTFQMRMIQEDNSKEINLKAFAYHDWAEPANPPAKKEWGMLEMPMLTQSSYCIIGEKFQKRKI